jgi:micrococcal nuclease
LQPVAFVTDPSQDMYDRFGRTLPYLDKADGWDHSVEAARAGAAQSSVYHGHPTARADEIAAAEQNAKAAGRGLWGPPCFGQTTSVPM